MEEYSKVVGGKLRFKGSILPTKEKSKKKKSRKDKQSDKIEKLLIKPGEEKTYKAVEMDKDTRTEAEKRFDERLSQRDKELIEKKSKMSYQQIVNEMNKKLDRLTDHNDMPRIAAAGLG